MKRTVLTAVAMPLVAAAVVGGALLASHHTTVPSASPPVRSSSAGPVANRGPCEHPAVSMPFVGIAINPRISAHVTSFEQATGARIRVVEFYNGFSRPFQRWEAQQATALGALPLIQLNPRHVSLAQIAAGHYDPQIRKYAEAVRAFRCRVALSFGHEMNGWWYPWGQPRTSPATFIAAWRHIHDVFASQHVTNVIWSWDPSHQYRGRGASLASRWYPGNAYVDWIGLDGYLGSGQTVAGIFGRQLSSIRSVTSKPVFLAETGVAGGPSQTWQIARLFAALKKYNLAGLVWFDLNRKQPWRLEGRPAALAAYRRAVAGLR